MTPDRPAPGPPPGYVPRQAVETALEELERGLRAGAPLLALSGPEGIGRTTSLRVLESRLRGSFRCVTIPYAALQAGEICAWILGLLEEPADGPPEAALLAVADRLRARGRALVVLLDDGSAMPVATARRLATLVSESKGALHLVVILSDDVRAERLREAFADALREVRLDEPMRRDETDRLIDGLLAHWDAPRSVHQRFDAATRGRLHEACGGLPGPAGALASAVAHGETELRPPPAAPARALPRVDPFSPGTERAAYVPRAATERVLAGLERALEGGERRLLLQGPPGIGKTTLLRVLAQRMGGRMTPLHLPYPSLPPGQLARFALVLAGRSASDEPGEALLAHAAEADAGGAPLLLVIDDATALPDESRRWLAEALSREEAGLRLLACASDEPAAESLRADLGPGVAVHRLREPMDDAETAVYLRARLEHADAPEWVSGLLDDAAAAEICARAGGLPAAVQREADARIRAAAPRAASLARPGTSAPGRSRAARRPPARTPGRRRRLRRWLVALPFATGLLAGWAWILFGPAPPATPPPPLRERLVGPTASEPAPAGASQAEPGGPAVAETGSASPPAPQPRAPANAGPAAAAPAAETPAVPATGNAAERHTAIAEAAEAPADRATVEAPETPAAPATVEAAETPAAPATVEAAETPAAPATVEAAETPAAPATADGREMPAVEAAAPVGVNINAQPWARIVIDGREIGITPLGGVLLSPGLHRVRAHMADGRLVEREFEVSEDNRHLVIVP